MMETKIRLDRVRTLRLTPYAIRRGEAEFGTIERLGKRLQKAPTEDDLARLLWFLLVDEDPELTPLRVKEIMEAFVSGGWRWARERRLMRIFQLGERLMLDIAAAGKEA